MLLLISTILFAMHQHLYVTQYTTKYLPTLDVFTNSRASPLRIRNYCLENLVCLCVHVMPCINIYWSDYFPELELNMHTR